MDHDFYRNVLESLTDGVYFVNRNMQVTYWNKGAERISGYPPEEVIGKRCPDNPLRHIDGEGTELCINGCPLAATMEDGLRREANLFMHHKLGHRIPVFVRSSPMYDEKGEIIGAVEVFADDSKHACLIEEMEELRTEVFRDPLTNVGNRRYADIMLERLHNGFQKQGVPYGVLFVDIDRFKCINDRWGHLVGDQVLTMTARTLSGGLRPLDSICRWGGEEFLVLISNVREEGLVKLAGRVRMLVEQSWVDHEGQPIRVTASFGGGVVKNGESAQDVLDRADKQLYLSKKAGRNCVHVNDIKTSSGAVAG